MAHCDVCQEYEQGVQAGRKDLEPCTDYVMSELFRAWLVESMRKEVFGETQMLILASKARPAASEQQEGQQEEDGARGGARRGRHGGKARRQH